MLLTKEQQTGLKYLQKLLSTNQAKFNIPNDAPLKDLFIRKDDSNVPNVFEQDYTVAQILSFDPEGEISDEYYELDFIAESANIMRDSVQDIPHFYASPDGSGLIPINKNGLEPLTLNTVEALSSTVASYAGLYQQLSNTLVTTREIGDGEFEVIPGDLSDPEVLNRMVVKNEKGQWEPAFSDLSKFQSEMKQDRLDAMVELERVVRSNNVYIREEDGQYSQMKLADDRTLYRGDYDRPTLEASIREKHPTVHGPVAMWIMRLFQSIGIPWFNEQIHAQEEAERLFAEELNPRLEARQQESANIRNTHANEVAADALPDKNWASYSAVETALLNPDSARGKEVAGLKELAYNFEIVGLLAGVVSLEANPEMTNQIIEGILTGKQLWKDPKYKDHLENGFRKFNEAKEAARGAYGQDDPTLMQDLLRNCIQNLSNYAGSMVPLDNKANKVLDLTNNIIDYAQLYPSLQPAIRGEKITERIKGITHMSALAKEGLEAQYKLANRNVKPEQLGNEVGLYLAMKTAEQINLSRALQIKNGTLDQSDDFISLLGKYGRESFQNALMNSSFAKEFDYQDSPVTNVKRGARLAVDGYTNGSRAEIVGIARDAAKEFSALQKGENAEGESNTHEDRVAVYRPMARPDSTRPAIMPAEDAGPKIG